VVRFSHNSLRLAATAAAIIGGHQSNEVFVPHGLQRTAQNLRCGRAREHDPVVRSESQIQSCEVAMMSRKLLRGAPTLPCATAFS